MLKKMGCGSIDQVCLCGLCSFVEDRTDRRDALRDHAKKAARRVKKLDRLQRLATTAPSTDVLAPSFSTKNLLADLSTSGAL